MESIFETLEKLIIKEISFKINPFNNLNNNHNHPHNNVQKKIKKNQKKNLQKREEWIKLLKTTQHHLSQN